MGGMAIAFFGSSLLSSYWNGAATYYRGLVRALHARGHRVTFYEPDVLDRQAHRDLEPPDWARVVVYGEDGVCAALASASSADVIVKASGIGAFDALLEREVPALRSAGRAVVFWDVDAPATLDRLQADPGDPLREHVPRYDAVLTYGGGPPVVEAYRSLGARGCEPVYNALDPDTHHPAPPDPHFAARLGLLANRLPDREARVRAFFFAAAQALPDAPFVLGGSGWNGDACTPNVRCVGHVSTRDHNAFNCSAEVVLNVNRESMARIGHSPPTRIFEAAGAGACILCDAWPGLEAFLEPDREVLVADGGAAVAEHLRRLDPARARAIGAAALARVRAQHTYRHRAEQVEAILEGRRRTATGW